LLSRINSFLETTFTGILDGTWKCLPPLAATSHFYPPSVSFVSPPDTITPLHRGNVINKLETEYNSLIRLLQERKKKFEASIDWEGGDEQELESSASDEDQEFEVEAIIGKKTVNNQVYYKVKWKYYTEKEWLREEHLTNCKDLITAFEDSQ